MAYTPKHFRKSGNISRESAKRLFEVGRYIEQRPRNKVVPGGGPVDFGGLTALVLTTTLTKGSGLTPGTGMAKIQQFNGTVFSDSGTSTYKVYNITDKQVVSGALIWCGVGYGSFAFIDTACANLS